MQLIHIQQLRKLVVAFCILIDIAGCGKQKEDESVLRNQQASKVAAKQEARIHQNGDIQKRFIAMQPLLTESAQVQAWISTRMEDKRAIHIRGNDFYPNKFDSLDLDPVAFGPNNVFYFTVQDYALVEIKPDKTFSLVAVAGDTPGPAKDDEGQEILNYFGPIYLLNDGSFITLMDGPIILHINNNKEDDSLNDVQPVKFLASDGRAFTGIEDPDVVKNHPYPWMPYLSQLYVDESGLVYVKTEVPAPEDSHNHPFHNKWFKFRLTYKTINLKDQPFDGRIRYLDDVYETDVFATDVQEVKNAPDRYVDMPEEHQRWLDETLFTYTLGPDGYIYAVEQGKDNQTPDRVIRIGDPGLSSLRKQATRVTIAEFKHGELTGSLAFSPKGELAVGARNAIYLITPNSSKSILDKTQ